MDFVSRSLSLYPEGGDLRLQNCRILILGLGGVGCAAAEALCRAGIGRFTLMDGDCYSVTNKNRQLYAVEDTLGKNKARVAAERLKSINPEAVVEAIDRFYTPEDPLPLAGYDFICDCIDDVAAKLSLIERAAAAGVPILSAMGAGGKCDPTRFRVTDLSKTHTCPLAKKMRVELRKRGIHHLPVVFSDEAARCVTTPPSSVSFVPPVMGFVMASHVVKTLLNIE